MDISDLKKKSLKDLKELCKGDRHKYKGYSKYTRKKDLLKFIIRLNSPNSNHKRVAPIIPNLYSLFETEEELNDRYAEMYMEKPIGDEINSLITELNGRYPRSDVIFDSHNDPNNDMIYKANKKKYISQYDSLGESGEQILYHGTNEENLTSILGDDFRLTSNPVHGSLFGKGIYFTNDIEKAIYYSERGKKTKYIIVCIVHTGDIVQGRANMDIHPLIPHSDKRYDTSVDNISNPKQFIKKKNGTYNILGIITIENYISNNSDPNRIILNSSFRVKNTMYDDIVLYWVPDHYTHLLPNIDIKLMKRLATIKGCKVFNPIAGFHCSKTQLSVIGHTFVCVIHDKYNFDIVRIFTSKHKDELITI